MSAPIPQPRTAQPSKGLNVSLWVVQGVLALTFVGTGLWKLTTPIAELAAIIPWTGQVSIGTVRAIAAIDVTGGLGVLLPSITRIKPVLTVLAALGCFTLMLAAALFHFARSEAANTPFNFFLAALCLFVAWGVTAKRRSPHDCSSHDPFWAASRAVSIHERKERSAKHE